LGVERRERGEQKVQPRVRHLAEPKTFVAARELAVSILKKNKTTTATEKGVDEGGEEWNTDAGVWGGSAWRCGGGGNATRPRSTPLRRAISQPKKRPGNAHAHAPNSAST
jgi:hypothetical protein